MNRLWIRFSILISTFFLVLILLPLSTLFVLDQLEIIQVQDTDLGPEPEDVFALQEIPHQLITITIAIGLIGAGLGIWLSRGLTAPIEAVAAAARQIGSGDLSGRVPVFDHSQELIQLAEAFNDMAEELAHAEQLRRNLLADVSHELRTPLTALSGQLRAGLDGVFTLDEETTANLYGQTQYLIHLVEDLHLLAQAEANQLPLNFTDIDLGELWQEIAANFAILAAEKEIHFTLQIADNLPSIYADVIRLRQIFTNLLANALRHTPHHGQIRVQIRPSADNELVVEIYDSGDGILPEHLPHLFNRFYRTDNARSRDTGGSGLGLAIVKAIVVAHQGTITVESAGSSQGSTFILRFPSSVVHKSQGKIPPREQHYRKKR